MSLSSLIFSHLSASSTTLLPPASTISLTWIHLCKKCQETKRKVSVFQVECHCIKISKEKCHRHHIRISKEKCHRILFPKKLCVTVSRCPSAAAISRGEQLSKPAVRIAGPYLRKMQLFTEPEKFWTNTVSEKNAHSTEGENLDTR